MILDPLHGHGGLRRLILMDCDHLSPEMLRICLERTPGLMFVDTRGTTEVGVIELQAMNPLLVIVSGPFVMPTIR